MEYTEKQKLEFKARFAQTRLYQMALVVPVGGAVLLLLMSEPIVADIGPQAVLLGTAFLVLVSAGFSWLNWRCPACRKYLGRKLSPTHCRSCGLALRSR